MVVSSHLILKPYLFVLSNTLLDAYGLEDRVFYETLLQQRPDSEMAQEWCLFYGILDDQAARKLYEKYCKRKGITPKPLPPSPVKKASTATTSSQQVNKKRKVTADTGVAESKDSD